MSAFQAADRTRPAPGIVVAVAALLFAVAVWPALTHDFITSVDLYNHVGRAVTLASFHANPNYALYFEQAWSFLPVQALDAIVYVLSPSLDQVRLGQALILIAFLLVFSGVMVLHRSLHGHVSLWPTAAAALLINRLVLAGVINTLIGFGLALYGVALWHALRDAVAWRRTAMLLGAAFVVCLSHLVAFGCFGLIVLAMMLTQLVRTRAGFSAWMARAIELGCAFLPPLVLASLSTPVGDNTFTVAWHDFGSRLSAFLVPLTYRPVVEAAVLGGVAMAFGLCAWRGRLRVHPGAGAAVVLLTLLQLVMPDVVATAAGADHRLPIIIFLLAVAAVDVTAVAPLPASLFVAALLLAVGTKSVVADRQWSRDAPIYAEVLDALHTLPDGARVAVAWPHFTGAADPASSVRMLAQWWVVPHGGFVQDFWALPGQAPMRIRPEWLAIGRRTAASEVWAALTRGAGDLSAGQRAALAALPRFDYVVAVAPEPFEIARPPSFLRLELARPHIRIYRVMK